MGNCPRRAAASWESAADGNGMRHLISQLWYGQQRDRRGADSRCSRYGADKYLPADVDLKGDFTQSPSVDLGTKFRGPNPALGKVTGTQASKMMVCREATEGIRLERSATVNVFFFSEVNFL